MKRGGPLKRYKRLESKSSMKRTAMKKKRRKKRNVFIEGAHWENQNYLDWVKSQPCVLTGLPADDAHHMIGMFGFGGMGMTAPDYMSMPVTRGSHDLFHTDPELQKMQPYYVLKTLDKAFRAGVLVMAN